VIVQDQSSRNIHSDTPRAFAQDGMALALTQEAVAAGVLTALEPVQRRFVLPRNGLFGAVGRGLLSEISRQPRARVLLGRPGRR
jgi:hypothetical protein